MGLDQYFTAKRHATPSEFGTKRDNDLFYGLMKAIGDDEASCRDQRYGTAEVAMTVGYLRKANAVHGWIVQNCQNGVDECQESHLSRDTIATLADLCRKVVHNPELAPKLLPTTQGFFFGSYEYDAFYLGDLCETLEICERMLKLPEDWHFYYQSSW